jgi:hypothetical protein
VTAKLSNTCLILKALFSSVASHCKYKIKKERGGRRGLKKA